jgi:hypothetical protein
MYSCETCDFQAKYPSLFRTHQMSLKHRRHIGLFARMTYWRLCANMRKRDLEHVD